MASDTDDPRTPCGFVAMIVRPMPASRAVNRLVGTRFDRQPQGTDHALDRGGIEDLRRSQVIFVDRRLFRPSAG